MSFSLHQLASRMHLYLRLLAVACSVTSKSTDARYGAAVLATVPVFVALFTTLSLFGVVLVKELPFWVFLVTPLTVAFAVYGVNVRALQTYRHEIKELQHRRDTRLYLLIVSAVFLYVFLIISLAGPYARG